jgi:hypothetical protein
VGHLEQISCKANQILEPQRLESQLRAELAKLGRHGIVEEIVPVTMATGTSRCSS